MLRLSATVTLLTLPFGSLDVRFSELSQALEGVLPIDLGSLAALVSGFTLVSFASRWRRQSLPRIAE